MNCKCLFSRNCFNTFSVKCQFEINYYDDSIGVPNGVLAIEVGLPFIVVFGVVNVFSRRTFKKITATNKMNKKCLLNVYSV